MQESDDSLRDLSTAILRIRVLKLLPRVDPASWDWPLHWMIFLVHMYIYICIKWFCGCVLLPLLHAAATLTLDDAAKAATVQHSDDDCWRQSSAISWLVFDSCLIVTWLPWFGSFSNQAWHPLEGREDLKKLHCTTQQITKNARFRHETKRQFYSNSVYTFKL